LYQNKRRGILMMKLLLLAVIVLAKVLITKGVALVCIILSFIFKGKQLHKSAFEWDNYFLSLNDDFVYKYTKIIYIISTVLSACVMLLMLKFLDFQYPIFLTLIVLMVCILISWYRYQKNGKSYIKSKIYEIKESIKSNDTP
jgi:uncharacterized membrane protein